MTESSPPERTNLAGVFDSLPAISFGSSLRAELSIALRHLSSKKSETMVSIVTLISMIGVMAAVAIVHVVLGVMTGFELDLREKILGANTHIVVQNTGGIGLSFRLIEDYEAVIEAANELDGVVGASPYVFTKLLIRNSMTYDGIVVKGVDAQRTQTVTNLVADLTEGLEGAFLDADLESRRAVMKQMEGNPSDSTPPGIILGSDLAANLGAVPGSEVELWNPMSNQRGPFGMPMPDIRRFRVVGLSKSGYYEYDTTYAYVLNTEIQKFLAIGDRMTAVEMKLEDIYEAPRITENLNQYFSLSTTGQVETDSGDRIDGVTVTATPTPTYSVVLNYDDFGPQSAANRIIGMKWWQWDAHGDSNLSTKYDIQVVVYDSISLDKIKAEFPIIPEIKQDYRYLTLHDALEYLDEEIQTDVLADVTATLNNTKAKLDKLERTSGATGGQFTTTTNSRGSFALDLPSDIWTFKFEKENYPSFESDPLAISTAGTVLRVVLDDKSGIRRVSRTNPKRSYQARHWQEIYGGLFEALQLEKVVSGLILFASICLASLLILNTLIMVVLTKGKEIATLKALGCSRAGIQRIFIIEGTIIGVIGALLGTGGGFGACLFLKWVGYPLDSNVYLLNKLPVELEPMNFVVVGIAAVSMCFLATLFPAYRAAALNPVDGLRYE